jgi:High potential iron-sulfur protein
MSHNISRRELMKSGLCASALLPTLGLVGNDSKAANLTPLDPSDPQAKALGFATDTSKVDPSAHPTYKPGQRCGTCQQYQGKPTDPTAACLIFAGHSVPSAGWCMVWTQRAG